MARNGSRGFRLAKLLELRERQVELCRDRVERCRAELERWEVHRRDVAARRSADGLAPGGGVSQGAADLQLREQGRRWYQRELIRIGKAAEQRRQDLEAARAELWQAEQRRERIDRLRQRFEAEQKRQDKRARRRRLNRWAQTPSNGSP
ncbi:MAG: hypothetical protein V5A50_13585 [Thiohalorhabdus sp.]|uniref:hypothetical protein n=1 Tax=Thiohalorhabdus sp. TaxID=3094134 RepID=UPI002FC2837A